MKKYTYDELPSKIKELITTLKTDNDKPLMTEYWELKTENQQLRQALETAIYLIDYEGSTEAVKKQVRILKENLNSGK